MQMQGPSTPGYPEFALLFYGAAGSPLSPVGLVAEGVFLFFGNKLRQALEVLPMLTFHSILAASASKEP